MTSPAVDDRQKQDVWEGRDREDQSMGPPDSEAPNEPPTDDRRSGQDMGNADYHRGSSVGGASHHAGKTDASFREKQVKPNKVYVGGLPEHTRPEDLQTCFGKIGKIVNIELKVGYGFVEFDSREAAETSVAKYHEGFFMGNKIRVELSHGGGRSAKYNGDPGACFKCGMMGHWARECPNHSTSRRSHHSNDPPLLDRLQPARDYPPPARDYPPPSRDYPPYRDDLGPGRYPPRDARYGYEYGLPPPSREYRRPSSPMRDYRDYPTGPPRREYEDYRARGPPPPPPPAAPSRYDVQRNYYPPDDPMVYPPRGHGPPPPQPPRDPYERYERRPPSDRYSYPSARPRTPPGGPSVPGGPPPRSREDFDRGPPPPPRDYSGDMRGRPVSPPHRYASDYVRPGSPEAGAQRYRRRSGSPPPRSSGAGPYETAGFAGNGYSGGSVPPPPPPPSGPPTRGGGGGSSRDYIPRNGREAPEPSSGGYRRA